MKGKISSNALSTWPDTWVDPVSEFSWKGTIDDAAGAGSTCRTAKKYTNTTFPPVTLVPTSVPTPAAIPIAGTTRKDPFYSTRIFAVREYVDKSWYKKAFPSESALLPCTWITPFNLPVIAPPVANEGRGTQLVTAHMTSLVAGSPPQTQSSSTVGSEQSTQGSAIPLITVVPTTTSPAPQLPMSQTSLQDSSSSVDTTISEHPVVLGTASLVEASSASSLAPVPDSTVQTSVSLSPPGSQIEGALVSLLAQPKSTTPGPVSAAPVATAEQPTVSSSRDAIAAAILSIFSADSASVDQPAATIAVITSHDEVSTAAPTPPTSAAEPSTGQEAGPSDAQTSISDIAVTPTAQNSDTFITSNSIPSTAMALSPGSKTFSYAPLSSSAGLLLAGQTLAPGGSPVTVSGTTLSLLPGGSSIAANGATYRVPTGAPAAIPNTAGDALAPFSYDPTSSHIIFAGETISVGGPPITISGTTFSAAAGGSDIVIDGQTQAIEFTTSPKNSRSTTTSNYNPVPTQGSEGVVIDSTTILPGSAATVNGATMSVPSSGTQLIVNGNTYQLADTIPGPTEAGAQFHTISLLSGGSSLAIGGITILLPTASSLPAEYFLPPNGKGMSYVPITKGSLTGIVLYGHTLLPGSTITTLGNTIAIPTSGAKLLVDGETYELAPYFSTPLPFTTKAGSSAINPAATGVITAAPNILSFTPVTSGSLTGIVIGTQTIPQGSLATVAGYTISVPTSGSNIIVDGEPYTLPTSSPAAGSEDLITVGPITFPYTPVTSGTVAGIAIAGVTLFPGSARTIGGGILSLPSPSGSAPPSALVIDGTSYALATPLPTTLGPGAITAGSDILSYNPITSGSEVGLSIAETTIVPGSVITTEGETISLPPPSSGTEPTQLIVDGTTYPLIPGLSTQPNQIITFGENTLSYSLTTAHGTPEVIIGTKTLRPGGPAVTVSGEKLSLVSGATQIVVAKGSSTVTEAVVQPTTANVQSSAGGVVASGSASGQYVASGPASASGKAVSGALRKRWMGRVGAGFVVGVGVLLSIV